jgi:glutaredoxin
MNRTYKNVHFMLSLALLLGAGSAHAQLYKWVGPDGKITYSDAPPPSTVKKVETRSGFGEASGPPLPFELAEAARNHPVTLYTQDKCAPCEEGRKLLNARGIPFTEKTVSTAEDLAKLQQVGDGTVPMLLIGRSKQPGFSASGWSAALTGAGYPESSKLPPGYRNPAPQPAAPAPVAAVKKNDAEQSVSRSEELPAATGKAPPGFRF